MALLNAPQIAKRYFGLHFQEGVAEYQHPKQNEGKPYRILVRENAIQRMNPSFEGRPIYVHHVNGVELSTMKEDSVGYVVKSFRNELDGKWWVEFLINDTRGEEKIKQGWKLSNAYDVTEAGGGGRHINVEYVQDVLNGEFEHLAIVPNPRYENSIILTPEDFKAYNDKLKAARDRVVNSTGDQTMSVIRKFFNRSEVAADKMKEVLTLSFALANGKELTVEQLIADREAADAAKKKNDDQIAEGQYPMANDDHMVEVEEAGEKKKMKVKDCVSKYNEMHKAATKEPGADETAGEGDEAAKKEFEAKQNALTARETEIKKREDAAKAERDQLTKEQEALKADRFKTRQNAIDNDKPPVIPEVKIVTMEDRLAAGRKYL